MDSFIKYLIESKEYLGNLKENQNVHIVIGNESCDLDSTVCSITLGYYLNECIYKNNAPFVQVLPVINVSSEDFLLRTEVCYILKKLGVDTKFLIFRDDVNFEEMRNACNLRVSLVDHHVLPPVDEFLHDCVVQIFDHRPIDTSYKWNEESVNINIKQVGSCATLITQEILKTNDNILCRELATLLYYTIIYDTIALTPENGKVKELDVVIAEKLVKKFGFEDTPKSVFDELWEAHNDVSHLTPKQLLSRDLKIVDGIPVPVLPMLVERYLKLPDVSAAISSFASEKNTSTVVLMGIEAKAEVKRDLAVYNKSKDKCPLFNLLLHKLKNHQETPLCLNEVVVDVPDVVCYRQNNVKPTRKQILPIIKEAVQQYKTSQ